MEFKGRGAPPSPREHSDVEFKGGCAPPPPQGRGMIRQEGAVSEVLVLESQVNFLQACWCEVQQRGDAPPSPEGRIRWDEAGGAGCRGMEMQRSCAEERSTHTRSVHRRRVEE